MNRIIKNKKIFIQILPIGLITVSKSLFTVLKPSGTVLKRLGTVLKPSGTVLKRLGTVLKTSNTVLKRLGTVLKTSGTVGYGRVRLGTVEYGRILSGTVRYGWVRVRYATVRYTLKYACGYSILVTFSKEQNYKLK